jgi:hypothetical protein
MPFETLLQQAREEDRQARAGSWTHAPLPQQPAAERSNRVWWILGIIGGVTLLACVACLVIFFVVRERIGLTVGESSAGAAAREQILLGARGQYGLQWDMLHPAHQEVVSRDLFTDCGRIRDISDVQVIVEFNEETQVPRLGQVTTRVVTYTLTEDGQSTAEAIRMVSANGQWRWVMEPSDLSIYQAGRCPT